MAIKKFAVAAYDDEEVLFPAVKKVRSSGYKMHDVYTPFPVHGLDHAMGLRQTSLHTAGFIFGLTGTTTAVSFMTWSFTKDWPVNIGGKPNFALPAWIPITFELTVLMAAVGMVLTFCYLCQLAPFIKKHHFHARATACEPEGEDHDAATEILELERVAVEVLSDNRGRYGADREML